MFLVKKDGTTESLQAIRQTTTITSAWSLDNMCTEGLALHKDVNTDCSYSSTLVGWQVITKPIRRPSIGRRRAFAEANMKSILCLPLLILLMPSAYAAELPGDSADGSFLHDANCLGCHDTGIYTRKDRRIRSLDALKGQLANCSHIANLEFSAIEMQNIIKYLNDQFYQFR